MQIVPAQLWIAGQAGNRAWLCECLRWTRADAVAILDEFGMTPDQRAELRAAGYWVERLCSGTIYALFRYDVAHPRFGWTLRPDERFLKDQDLVEPPPPPNFGASLAVALRRELHVPRRSCWSRRLRPATLPRASAC